jgi:hypothetical protein
LLVTTKSIENTKENGGAAGVEKTATTTQRMLATIESGTTKSFLNIGNSDIERIETKFLQSHTSGVSKSSKMEALLLVLSGRL